MQTVMVVLLEESEEIQENLLLIILSVLGRNENVCISTSYQLPPSYLSLLGYYWILLMLIFLASFFLGFLEYHQGWEEACYEYYRAM